MKKFIMFPIAFMLIACLFAGCGGDDDDDDGIIGPGGEGMGFSSMKAGDWSESRTPDGDRDIMKFVGEDTWQGRSCIVLEFESYSAGESSVMQIWIDKTTFEAVVMIVEIDGEYVRMDATAATDVPGTDEVWETPTTEKVGTEKYTTPTGKTVDATIYRTQTSFGVDEDWVSGEVPFDMVKSLTDGTLTSSLYDFGTGATRIISKQQAEAAEPFAIPNIPFDPGDPGNPADPGDPGLPGAIVVTVGAGATPTIQVSSPIHNLMVFQGFGPIWGFAVPGGAPPLSGPFQYGVVPDGAEDVGFVAPPLVAGQAYIIQAIFAEENAIPGMGTLEFVR